MDISNLSNSAIDLKIGDKSYKISRLNISELFVVFQKEAKEEYIGDVKLVAETINDKNERLEFLSKQMKELPKGKVLEELASDKMNSVDGGITLMYLILNKHQKITKEEVTNLVSNQSNATDIAAIVQFATCIDQVTEKKM